MLPYQFFSTAQVLARWLMRTDVLTGYVFFPQFCCVFCLCLKLGTESMTVWLRTQVTGWSWNSGKRGSNMAHIVFIRHSLYCLFVFVFLISALDLWPKNTNVSALGITDKCQRQIYQISLTSTKGNKVTVTEKLGPDRVESLHIDKDAGEESLEHLAQYVSQQPDEPQLQVLRHFLQNPTSLLSHLLHRQPRLHGDLKRKQETLFMKATKWTSMKHLFTSPRPTSLAM